MPETFAIYIYFYFIYFLCPKSLSRLACWVSYIVLSHQIPIRGVDKIVIPTMYYMDFWQLASPIWMWSSFIHCIWFGPFFSKMRIKATRNGRRIEVCSSALSQPNDDQNSDLQKRPGYIPEENEKYRSGNRSRGAWKSKVWDFFHRKWAKCKY